MKEATVFYADALGFARMASAPGAASALDALGDMARIFSDLHALAPWIGHARWRGRYGLSDSVFLVADDPVDACAGAAEILFNLAYYNCRAPSSVLMRGALAFGEAKQAPPIFPATATANLVGEAVVRAVRLEQTSGIKGPRLLVSPEIVGLLEARTPRAPLRWLLDAPEGAPAEILWLLPPDPKDVDPLLIADVARAAVDLFLGNACDKEALPHYIGYLDLLDRSLRRLRDTDRARAEVPIRSAEFQRAISVLESMPSTPASLLPRLRELSSASK